MKTCKQVVARNRSPQYEAKVASINDFGYSDSKLVVNFATKGVVKIIMLTQ